MESATLDDLMIWNDHLAALVEAGVPIDVGLAPTKEDISDTLQGINTIVARRVSQGASLMDALEDSAVPTAYRCLVQLGLKSGDFSAMLAGNRRLGESVDESRYTLQSGLLYPLIVCVFAYFGLLGLCLFLVPTLENLHRSLQHSPGLALLAIQSLRDALPYWAALPPLLLLCVGTVWIRRAARRHRASPFRTNQLWMGIPGPSRVIGLQRCAYFADALATLVDRNLALEESLRIAAGACDDASLRAGADALADSLKIGSTPSDGGVAALRFPPFLRWAVWHSEATIGRACALRMAANLYRDAALHRSERWRTAAPLVACALLGGVVTLLYGLALFLPIVELMKQLAS